MEQKVSDYLKWLEMRFYSRTRKDHIRKTLGRLIHFLNEQYAIEAWQVVSEQHLLAFASWAANEYQPAKGKNKGKQIAAYSLANWLSCIRCFFVWMHRQGFILGDPAILLPSPKIEETLPHIPSEDQMARLIETPDITTSTGMRDRAIFELLYATGLRKSEVVKLDFRDVDVGGQQLFVHEGKGKKDRMVPITQQACGWLSRYLTEARPALALHSTASSAFFLNHHGGRLTGGTLAWCLDRYAKRAGVKASLHTFRHCVATHLLRRGASVRMVQQLLGHKKLDITQRYTHLAVSDLKAAVERAQDGGLLR